MSINTYTRLKTTYSLGLKEEKKKGDWLSKWGSYLNLFGETGKVNAV